MNFKEMKKNNLPREKLIKNGVESLSNEELIAVLLRCGNKQKNVLELANEVINSVTNIGFLKDLTFNELKNIKGIKDSKASILISCFELVKRCYSYRGDDAQYSSCDKVYELMQPILSLEKREVLYCLFLNSKCRLIEKREITAGSINSLVFSNQEILKRALKLSALSIILVHNHPSGDSTPSKQDIDSTLVLKNSLKMIGVILLDHIIIGNDTYYSMANKHII